VETASDDGQVASIQFGWRFAFLELSASGGVERKKGTNFKRTIGIMGGIR